MYDPVIVDIWGMVKGRDSILCFPHMDSPLSYHNWGGNTTGIFYLVLLLFNSLKLS